MKTLLLTCDAPTQTWPTGPAGAQRPTNDHPTKTGIIGMIANALGRDYDDPIDDLAALDFAVRVDRAGIMERDYRTAGGRDYPALPADTLRGMKVDTTPAGRTVRAQPIKNIDPASPKKSPLGAPAHTLLTNGKQVIDHYLADARFTVALTGNDGVIDAAANAVRNPCRSVYLGRRQHPPAEPLFRQVTDHADPLAALRDNPPTGRHDPAPWDAYFSAPGDATAVDVYDQPVIYGTAPRRHLRREAHTTLSDDSAPADDLSAFL